MKDHHPGAAQERKMQQLLLKNKTRPVAMMLLLVGYFAISVWLYFLTDFSFANKLLFDMPITLAFVVLAGIAYAVTGGDDDPE